MHLGSLLSTPEMSVEGRIHKHIYAMRLKSVSYRTRHSAGSGDRSSERHPSDSHTVAGRADPTWIARTKILFCQHNLF